MLNELLQGQKEVSFLGFIQMFHSYHFFERKLALSRRGKIAVSERSVEVASIYQRKQELIELLAGSQISFSKLFEAKMSFPSIASTDSGKMPRNELVEEK
jgi:ABC-type Zn2+ transport system substrate-binding protein/surface adhesin